MRIIVPERKRLSNIAKHHIDLARFQDGFSWDAYLAGPTRPSRSGRRRDRYIGLMDGMIVVAIVSPLGTEALSVVSIRPASRRERREYEQKA